MSLAPTPWSIDMDSVGEGWTESISIEDAEGNCVAHLTSGYQDGPSWSNANLIAAAPDLLEALQAVMVMWDVQQPRKLDDALTWRQNDERAHALAESAIAKAIGENHGSDTEKVQP